MAKIYFDAATKGNPGRSACAIIIKENSQRYTDSKLIEDSMMQGKVKNAKFKVYFENIEILEQSFDLMFVRWIPRKQNKEANQLAQQTLYKLTSQ